MHSIAKLHDEERQELFQNTASRIGMNVAIIEKDFWVCTSQEKVDTLRI